MPTVATPTSNRHAGARPENGTATRTTPSSKPRARSDLLPGWVPERPSWVGIYPSENSRPKPSRIRPSQTQLPQTQLPQTQPPQTQPPPAQPHRSERPRPEPRARTGRGNAVVVQPGDSLWSLAERHLGPGATDREIAQEWPHWFTANRAVIGSDPDLLRPGERLRTPTDDARRGNRSAHKASGARAGADGKAGSKVETRAGADGRTGAKAGFRGAW
jgi:nucleoid-associated protein YgaU